MLVTIADHGPPPAVAAATATIAAHAQHWCDIVTPRQGHCHPCHRCCQAAALGGLSRPPPPHDDCIVLPPPPQRGRLEEGIVGHDSRPRNHSRCCHHRCRNSRPRMASAPAVIVVEQQSCKGRAECPPPHDDDVVVPPTSTSPLTKSCSNGGAGVHLSSATLSGWRWCDVVAPRQGSRHPRRCRCQAVASRGLS